jgi:hypothetical protein
MIQSVIARGAEAAVYETFAVHAEGTSLTNNNTGMNVHKHECT